MEKSEELTLDAKQRHLAKLKKRLAKHERKLERSLRVSQAKEHVRKKLKEQALIEAAENQSLLKENLSFDSADDQSFNNSCLSPFVSKDSDVTVVDLTTGDITLSMVKEGDITLSNINQGNIIPLNATSGTTTPLKSSKITKSSSSFVKDGLERRKPQSKDEMKKSRNSSPRIGIPIQMIESEEDRKKITDTSLAKATPIQRRPTSVVVKNSLTTEAPTSRSKDFRQTDASVKENEEFTDRILSKKHERSHAEEHQESTTTATSINKDQKLKDTPIKENERITERTSYKRQDRTRSRHSEENRASLKDATASLDKKSPRMESSVSAMTVKQDSPNLNMNVLDERTNQRQRKDCSDVPKISKKMQSPSNRVSFLNAKNASFSNECPSPIKVVTPKHQSFLSSNHKRSSTNQKPSPTNQKSSTNHMTSMTKKLSPGNHMTPTNQKTSSNQKLSPGNHKTSTNQKFSSNQRPMETNQNQTPSSNQKSATNQESLMNQTSFSTNQKISSPDQKTSPSNQKSRLDDSGISQSSLEISKTSFLNDSLSLTPTFGDDDAVRSRSRGQVDKPQSENKLQDPKQKLHFQTSEIDFSGFESCDNGSQKIRRKVDKPHSENKVQDPKQTLNFQASEVNFSGLESCDPFERGQKKKTAKLVHEISNFDTIEFISQTKSASKPKVNVRDHQLSVNLQHQTSKTKLKEAEFESVTEKSVDSRSTRKSENLVIADRKSAATKDLDSNSEKISENLFPNDADVQILSPKDLNFGTMEGMDPDLPILIIDRKSKRRSRSKHKSSRQTSSPILSQKEAATSIKISTSGAKTKSAADTRERSSKIDSPDKWREMDMQEDKMDPELTKHKRTGIQTDGFDPELTKNKKMEKQIDSQQTKNNITEMQPERNVKYIDGDIAEVSESDSQKSVSILVDTSKSFNTQRSASISFDTSKSPSMSCILDEKISVIESDDDDLTLTSPKSDDHFSQSLLKSSKKLSPKGCVGGNDCKTKFARNSKACENRFENSCSIMPSYKSGDSSSQEEKRSSQNSKLSDSLSLKRRKFKQRKRSLSHGKDGSESLGSSQDSKRIKVSETSQDSSSINSDAESLNCKLSTKSSRKGHKNNSQSSQDSNKCTKFENVEASISNSQNSSLSSNKTSKNPEMSTVTKNVTMDPKQNSELFQYSEFTELDVVEFSQFKFSEEFLTESSENSERGRKRKRHPSHLGMIVQRRSPRVASLVDSESSSNSCSDNTRHRRTKKEKCLIISSVFQYLIDETKREPGIKEFKLPDSQFKDLVEVKLLENNFELDDTRDISAAKTALCAERQESPKCNSDSLNIENRDIKSCDTPVISAAKTALCAERQESPKFNSDSLNLENRDIKSHDTSAIVICHKYDSSKVGKRDVDPCNKYEVHSSVKSSDNDYSVSDVQSSKICLNSKESEDINSQKKLSENRTRVQNSQKLKQSREISASVLKIQIQNSSQASVSDPKILEVEKLKEKTKAKDSERNVESMSDINVIYDSEPIDENFLDSDEESTSSKARHETLTTDLENDIKVIYDSEPLPDDSMSEEKCYHRNDATDLQENDLSTISEKDNSVICDNFEEKNDKNFENVVNGIENIEQESLKAENLESVVIGEPSKTLKSSALRPEQPENMDDSEVTFKNNIQLPISTPKFSAKIKRGQSKNLFRSSTSTPKCANLNQTPKTPNLDKIKSLTPKINAKFVDQVSNVESFETPKAEQPKFAENLDAYTTPKDANIRRHFNFADDNLSPPLFPTQKDLTPIGVRRLEDETSDSFIQLDDEETECDDLIGPTDCIKLCREENVVFISGGTWISDGLEYSYIVCLLPSAISVWSQGQGQWENELDWYLSQTYQAIEGWIIKKPNKVVLVILEEDKTGEQRVSLFFYDLLSGDSNMSVIDLHILPTNPVTSLLCCIVNEDQLIIGYNHCTSLTATKHLLIDGYKQMSLCCHLESTSGYLMDLAEVRHLECCVVGLTSKREALIWNHEAGFLIKKISLESVITPGVSLTAVHNIQGYLVCHLLYRVKSDSPGYVVIVNISNSSSLILHDYPSLQYPWKGLKYAAISGDSLLASDIQGNTGFWDMVSGELLANIPRSKVTSGNINQSDQTLYLGMDRGAVHIYPLENINLKS